MQLKVELLAHQVDHALAVLQSVGMLVQGLLQVQEP